MADYYPLLAKAVASLPNSTPEARRSIYERARKALYGQLRSLDPPVPEAVIEREARGLEEAVARIEVELSLEAQAPAAEIPPEPEVLAPPSSEAAAPEPQEPRDAPASPEVTAVSAEPEAVEAPAEVPAPTLAPESPAAVEGVAPAKAETTPEPPRRPATQGRIEARRPSVPVPAHEAPVPRRLWIVGGVVCVVVALVAVLAYALRDRPEDIARPPVAAEPSATEGGPGGKIVDRIDGGETRSAEPQPPSPPPPSVKHEEAAKPSLPPPEPPAAVARRAALLVEAPEEQAKVKTFLGTVVWRIDNTNNGPGEPLGLAVRAEIDIPEEKLQAVMTFQKNTDVTLPASHTIKLRFVIQPGGPLGSVTRVNVPYMRREETATGDPLNGVPVPIMENSFLVGLTKGGAEATNLDLVKTREWLDVPMVFANGRIAKLTFEKGTSGQRAIEDALTAWQAQ